MDWLIFAPTCALPFVVPFSFRNRLPVRTASKKFRLVGLFTGAHVAKTKDRNKTGVSGFRTNRYLL